MVELKATISSAGLVYLPKTVREDFKNRKVGIIPNTNAIVVFPQGARHVHVLKSVEIIAADLRHRIEMEGEKNDERGRFSQD